MTHSFLETAFQIGVSLARDARWHADQCSWFGPGLEEINGVMTPVYRTLGPEFYAGTSGIAWFLRDLVVFADDALLRRTCEGAMQQALNRADDIKDEHVIGLYMGKAGVGYAAIDLGLTQGRGDWITAGRVLLLDACKADPLAPGRRGVDIISGVAGVIPALLDLHSRLDDPTLLDLAVSLGDKLVKAARESDQGLSWDAFRFNSRDPDPDLCGFSHGAGGNGWALAELAAATGEERFRRASEGAIAYEQSWFSPEHGNWPDFRTRLPAREDTAAAGARGVTATDAVGRYPYASVWCHGAPGIALSRLRMYELTGRQDYVEQSFTALRTTAAAVTNMLRQPLASFSLCHGLAGNADVLLTGAATLRVDDAMALAHQVGRHGQELYGLARRPWPSGAPRGDYSPDLFVGEAGIGHFYLRLHNPEKVRTVLRIGPTSAMESSSSGTEARRPEMRM